MTINSSNRTALSIKLYLSVFKIFFNENNWFLRLEYISYSFSSCTVYVIHFKYYYILNLLEFNHMQYFVLSNKARAKILKQFSCRIESYFLIIGVMNLSICKLSIDNHFNGQEAQFILG